MGMIYYGGILYSGAGASEWGDIDGNLSDQTDLQNALDSKTEIDDTATSNLQTWSSDKIDTEINNIKPESLTPTEINNLINLI